MNEWWIGKKVEESGHGLCESIILSYVWKTENFNQDSKCPGWDSNQVPSEYKSEASTNLFGTFDLS